MKKILLFVFIFTINIYANNKYISTSIGYPSVNGATTKYGVGIEAGKLLEKNIFITLGIDKYNFSQFDILDISFSFNYQFGNRYKPYIGIEIGSGDLSWSSYPSNGKAISSDATSALYGLRVGASYKLSKKYDFIVNAKYLRSNFNTKVQTQTVSFIKQNSIANLAFGIKYKF